MVNTIYVTGATPGAKVHFIYGFGSGFISVPGCFGVTVDIGDSRVLASAIADAAGKTSFSSFVPRTISGQTVLIQLVELSSCRVSNLLTDSFPELDEA